MPKHASAGPKPGNIWNNTDVSVRGHVREGEWGGGPLVVRDCGTQPGTRPGITVKTVEVLREYPEVSQGRPWNCYREDPGSVAGKTLEALQGRPWKYYGNTRKCHREGPGSVTGKTLEVLQGRPWKCYRKDPGSSTGKSLELVQDTGKR